MGQTQLSEDVERLKESLGQLPEPVVKPALIVVSGLPGTGKSHFCRKLDEFLSFPILESDALRKVLSPSPSYSLRESNRLFQACHLLIEELLRRGISLIFDATNLIERHRERFYHIADQTGAKLVIVRVEAPAELVRQRLENRTIGADSTDKSEADWKVYRKMENSAQKIRRNHFVVDTSRDIAPVINKVVREVNR
jgi:predicted kinase